MLGWVVVVMILFQCLSIFQCIPISYNWEGWKGDGQRKTCLDMTALTYASASINIAQDIAILVLPIPWLVKLNTTRKKKFNILLMFNMGMLFVHPSPIFLLVLNSIVYVSARLFG
jgi:hypothetical protein